MFYGAEYDLEKLIKTHLFIICPNNSGSTFLKNALATSRHTWNLAREGQNTFGFSGPNTGHQPGALIWASTQELITQYTDINAYNWPVTKKAWYFQAYSHNPMAQVFVTKSPPFLLYIDQLYLHFENTKFLFMVRDPYAVVEGISRRKVRLGQASRPDILKIAATHIITCLVSQWKNIHAYPDCSVFLTYETMCEEPEHVAQLIRTLVPELDDLSLRQRISVKGMYNEDLRNMNEQQIDRLNKEDFRVINEIFEPNQDILKRFHYVIRT